MSWPIGQFEDPINKVLSMIVLVKSVLDGVDPP